MIRQLGPFRHPQYLAAFWFGRAVGCNECPYKAWAMKIARHRGMKKAIVALARRLAVIMHRI
jgi:hypothetical protein